MLTAVSMLQLPLPLPSKMARRPAPGPPAPPAPPELADQLAALFQFEDVVDTQYRGAPASQVTLSTFGSSLSKLSPPRRPDHPTKYHRRLASVLAQTL